jgi:predicted ribosome quality control (RQC) complex YloA/Tae2 family protein
MIRHIFTLQKLTEELTVLIGCKVIECWSQDKDQVIIAFYNGSEVHHLQIMTDTNLASVFQRHSGDRARKNNTDLLPNLIGDTLQNISIVPGDRILVLEFNSHKLNIFLFGGSRNGIILTGKNNQIIDAIKAKWIRKEDKLVYPSTKLPSLQDYTVETPLLEALSKCNLNLSRYYASEVCTEMNIDPKNKISDIKPEQFDDIIYQANVLIDKCRLTNEFFVYKNPATGHLLSLIPLHNQQSEPLIYQSLSAISRRVFMTIRDTNFTSLYNSLISRVNFTERQLTGKLKQSEDTENTIIRSNQYKLWADLLMSYPNGRQKQGKIIQLDDWEGNSLKISLDEKLTIYENAAKYFDKARSTREHSAMRQKLLPGYQKKLNELLILKDKLKACTNMKDMDKIKDDINKITGSQTQSKTDAGAGKFRTFDLGEGYILYVGKNAANNDELTVKFAKPNDLWLHARGNAGSHAVLRMPGKLQKPPKPILQAAAGIAAYYSQSRRAKYVPVAYTLKKNVHKPKGADPGSVVLSREDVIMVSPVLPEGIIGDD